MWRISRIRLRDFKVYSGEYEFQLSPVTAIVGRVGAGKSSLLQAIEFALFGREMEVRQRIARLADLVNLSSDSALVELELADGTRKALVRRSVGRGGRSRLELKLDDRRYLDEAAEEALAEMTGITGDDYDRVIYISHYALEDFIHGDRLKRTSLIDKILQIDILDNIQKIINITLKNIMKEIEKIRIKISYYEKYRDIIEKHGSLSKLKGVKASLERELEDLTRREADLSARYRELLEERRRYMDKISALQDKINAYYRAKSELELLEESGREAYISELGRIEELRDRFVGVMAEFEHMLDPQMLEKISREPDAAKLAELLQEAYMELAKIKGSLEEALSAADAQRRSLAARLDELRTEISGLRARVDQLEGAYRRFKEVSARYGSPEEVRRRLDEAREKVKELEKRTHYASSLRYIILYALETGAERCPVCGGKLDRDAASSKLKDIEREYSQELAQLEKARGELEALEDAYRELSSLLGTVSEYLKAREELERLAGEEEKTRARLDQAAKSYSQISRRLELLASFLSSVTPEAVEEMLRRYNKALRARQLREELESLERELKNLGLSGAALEAEEEFRAISEELDRIRRRKADINDELRKLSEVLANVDEELDMLRSRLEKYMYAYNRFSEISNKIDILKYNVRSRIIGEIEDELWRNFSKIYPYRDIASLGLTLREKAYEVEARLADGNVVGISKLSDGQRLAVALSLVISMRKLLSPKLGFLLLDDPLPYVDPSVRASLAGLIASLAAEYQVVVATQTEDLPKEIAANGVDVKVIELLRGSGRPEATTKDIFARKD
ncbi:MAG: SMC family ATPase [Thermoproteus sp.]